MTASKLSPRRAVLFDGFAGRGRFDGGRPGSAEYMMLAAQKAKGSTQIDLLPVEQAGKEFQSLESVAAEYRARGIYIDSFNDDCGNHLAGMLQLATGASLFVFLDPCGAVLPMDSIKDVLRKRGTWPRTEVLLNFSADLIRRAGGQLRRGSSTLAVLGKLTECAAACGGEMSRCELTSPQAAQIGSRPLTLSLLDTRLGSRWVPITDRSSRRSAGRLIISRSTI